MDKTLEILTSRIVAAVNPTRVYLFGSRARGDHNPDSDYDILVVYDGDITQRDIELKIRKHLREIRCAKDIFVLTSGHVQQFKHVPLSLANEATENGVLLYG